LSAIIAWQKISKINFFGGNKRRINIMEKKLPKSIRKYIRREKARIRREFLDKKEQKKQIQKLYDNTRNLRSGDK
jgi:hypothetical protein